MIKKDKIDNSKEHHRRSIRLKEFDYSQNGGYFITICTNGGECLFGNIVIGEMQLNKYGIIIRKEWLKTGEMRSNLLIDEFIIMPNHLHGIIMIMDNCRGTLSRLGGMPLRLNNLGSQCQIQYLLSFGYSKPQLPSKLIKSVTP